MSALQPDHPASLRAQWHAQHLARRQLFFSGSRPPPRSAPLAVPVPVPQQAPVAVQQEPVLPQEPLPAGLDPMAALEALLRADTPSMVLARQLRLWSARTAGVSILDLTGMRQTRAVVLPRMRAMWLLRVATPFSLPLIGRFFGDRDHTTVFHTLKVFPGRQPAFCAAVLAVLRQCEDQEACLERQC